MRTQPIAAVLFFVLVTFLTSASIGFGKVIFKTNTRSSLRWEGVVNNYQVSFKGIDDVGDKTLRCQLYHREGSKELVLGGCQE